ncbi:hypothetical protein BH09VER1_BH09VER1_40480 [soil metagenome]
MPLRISRRISWALGILLLVFIAGGAIIWKASTELMTPTRRALQDYHRDWLERPSEHGVTIQRFSALDGKVPCLLVTPDPSVGISKRGDTVRRQLQEKGLVLQPFGATFANLVLLHGRNGRKEDLLPVAERFCAVGFRCVIPDLPAQGESPLQVIRYATSDFEASIPASVLTEALTQFHLPSDPAGLWGMSMGGAYLAKAASLPSAPWKALVVVCSFDSLDAVVAQKAASYTGPAGPLFAKVVEELCVLRGGVSPADVQPAKWAASVTTPVFVAHGDHDSLISLSQGQLLYQAYASPDKIWTVVKDGDHDRILVTEHPLYAEMAAWYLKYLTPKN